MISVIGITAALILDKGKPATVSTILEVRTKGMGRYSQAACCSSRSRNVTPDETPIAVICLVSTGISKGQMLMSPINEYELVKAKAVAVGAFPCGRRVWGAIPVPCATARSEEWEGRVCAKAGREEADSEVSREG